MEKRYLEIMLQFIDSEHMKQITRKLNQKITVHGFRKGKAPNNRLLSEACTQPPSQGILCNVVREVLMPDDEPPAGDNPFLLASVRLPVTMATLALEGQEDQLPLSLEQLTQLHTVMDINHPEQSFNLPDNISKDELEHMSWDELFQLQLNQMQKDDQAEEHENEPAQPVPEEAPVDTQPESVVAEEAASSAPEPVDAEPAAVPEPQPIVYESVSTPTPEPAPAPVPAAPKPSATLPEPVKPFPVENPEPEEVDLRRDGRRYYLGYMRICPGTFYDFYNFCPIAEIISTKNAIILTEDEKRERFPNKSNINIYAKKEDEALSHDFDDNGLYVLEFFDEFIEDNIRNDGILNQTNKKYWVRRLRLNQGIRRPEDFGFFAVADIANLDEKLRSGSVITLPTSFTEPDVRNASVFLREQHRLVGPFRLLHNSLDGSVYIHPQLDSKNYELTVYYERGEEDTYFSVRINYDADADSTLSFERVYVNQNRLNASKEDLISQEQLIKELNRALQGLQPGNLDEQSFINSCFVGLDISETSLRMRRAKMLSMFQRWESAEEWLEQIGDSLAIMMEHAAARQDDSNFTRIAELLSRNPAFMQSIQHYHIIHDAIEDLETTRDELKAEITQIELTKKQRLEEMRAEQELVLMQDMQEKQQELAELEDKLQITRQAANLSDTVKSLEDKVLTARTELKSMRQEQVSIQEQTEQLLQNFRLQAQTPLNTISQYVMQDQVASILKDACKRAEDRESAAETHRLNNQEYLSSAERAVLAPQEVVDTLCERIQKYRPYSRNDIINLMICTTQGFLTVFSGGPGTGKTSTCDLIAHALGLDYPQDGNTGSRYAFVPVERGWNSKRDFIGYYNPLSQSFEKASRTVYNALEVTSSEADLANTQMLPPFLMLLDEANLSPMEYYWADFMRACDPTANPVPLELSDDLQWKISKSLRFLATVNSDHTTETLSMRLLDRAWIVIPPQFTEPRTVRFEEQYPAISMEELIKAFDTPDEERSIPPMIMDIRGKVFTHCREKLGCAISPRTKTAMKRYCAVASQLLESPLGDRDPWIIALDYAIAQRLLPKLQGNGDYRKPLEDLGRLLQNNSLTLSAELVGNMLRQGDRNMQYYQFFM